MIWFTVLKTFIVPAMLTIVVAGGGLYIKAKYDDYQTLKENNAGLTVAVNEICFFLYKRSYKKKQISRT